MGQVLIFHNQLAEAHLVKLFLAGEVMKLRFVAVALLAGATNAFRELHLPKELFSAEALQAAMSFDVLGVGQIVPLPVIR